MLCLPTERHVHGSFERQVQGSDEAEAPARLWGTTTPFCKGFQKINTPTNQDKNQTKQKAFSHDCQVIYKEKYPKPICIMGMAPICT